MKHKATKEELWHIKMVTSIVKSKKTNEIRCVGWLGQYDERQLKDFVDNYYTFLPETNEWLDEIDTERKDGKIG